MTTPSRRRLTRLRLAGGVRMVSAGADSNPAKSARSNTDHRKDLMKLPGASHAETTRHILLRHAVGPRQIKSGAGRAVSKESPPGNRRGWTGPTNRCPAKLGQTG